MITDQPIGRALLYVASNVAPDKHAAFSAWCDSIHHFDTMRIEGFLSLRRFELVTGLVAPGATEFRLLTLYQVADPSDADFSSPAYVEHTATYTPAPPGVVDGITYQRSVFERIHGADQTTQPVGRACISVLGRPDAWADETLEVARRQPEVLNASTAARPDESVVLIDVESLEDGQRVFDRVAGIDHGAARPSVQLFAQVFPVKGVLVRDRAVIAPRTY